MTSYEQIRDRLPTLYRPETADDQSLLARILRATADAVDQLKEEAGDVMQAHWFAYADRAIYSPYFRRDSQLRGLDLPDLDDPRLAQSSYVHDLGRLVSLLGLKPWEEPRALRETVEGFRQRAARTVALYRNGLGTVDALRGVVEAQLPTEQTATPETRDRPYSIEEFAPLVVRNLPVPSRGEPLGRVGPLMRWTVKNEGLRATSPTLYVEGVEPIAGLVDATQNPLIEIYEEGPSKHRLGIAFQGTVAPGETLRLRPAFNSWIGTDNGVHRATSEASGSRAADPTAPGPWASVADAPPANVTQIAQTRERMLWVAAESNAVGQVWRYNGESWTEIALPGQPLVNCLVEDHPYLLIGTDAGLKKMHLYPSSGDPLSVADVGGVNNVAVHAIHRSSRGSWWLATSSGAMEYDSLINADTPTRTQTVLDGAQVFSVVDDSTGTLFFGTDRGLFQLQAAGTWYWYEGKERGEGHPDWQPLPTAELPSQDEFFLPTVRSVYRGPDSSLWIGTDVGICRYVARPSRGAVGLAYETVLEAFPDVIAGQVYRIDEDARGLIWFATAQGLFQFDGRDFWQYQADGWVHLGRADTLFGDRPRPRGAWRFHRAVSRWQRNDDHRQSWEDFSEPPRSASEAAVRSVLWSDHVVAELGQWDGDKFTSRARVDPSNIVTRFKPTEQRIVDGGLPATPSLPVGNSTWRYLSLEPVDLTPSDDTPFWTMEGRLVPPPGDLSAAGPGRHDIESPPPPSHFDEAVFAYRPAAKVWFQWEVFQPLSVLARLRKRSPDEQLDPGVLDRIWKGIQQVRPAGVRAKLAVERTIVRG